jgi:chitodextrinase
VFRTAKGAPRLTATTAPVDWGTAATVTVKVDTDGAPVTGTVELREGDKTRGSVALTGDTATFKLPPGLSGGSHALTAAYTGSDAFNPAEVAVTVTVNLPPVWSAAKQYNGNAKVTYDGRVYVAAWWTQNQKPGDPTGPWQEQAMTEDGVALWTASRIFNSGDIAIYKDKKFRARWWTRNQAPGDPNGPWEEIAPPSPGGGPAAWTPTTVYNAGDRVTYNSHVYEAKWYTRNQTPGDPGGPWKQIK